MGREFLLLIFLVGIDDLSETGGSPCFRCWSCRRSAGRWRRWRLDAPAATRGMEETGELSRHACPKRSTAGASSRPMGWKRTSSRAPIPRLAARLKFLMKGVSRARRRRAADRFLGRLGDRRGASFRRLRRPARPAQLQQVRRLRRRHAAGAAAGAQSQPVVARRRPASPRPSACSPLIDTKPRIVDAPGAKPLRIAPPPNGGNVRFKDVTFAYHENAPALDGVTLDIPAGKKVALVGPSGSGKSTVFNLLLRFYETDGGRIDFDGQDIHAVTIASLRAAIALGQPGGIPVRRNVGANIAWGARARRQTTSRQAARAAAAHDFITRAAAGLRHARRRRRAQAFRRPAPAHRHRPRHAAQRADPSARRGHLGARHRERTPRAGRAQAPDEGTHHHRDRPPAYHRARRRPHLSCWTRAASPSRARTAS